MNNFDNYIRRNWYLQGFNAVPAFLYGPIHSMFFEMPNFLDYGYTGCIVIYKKDVCYYLYDWEDLRNIQNQLINRYEKDPSYLSFLLESDRKFCNETKNILLELADLSSLEKLSSANIASIWNNINTEYGRLLSVSHIVEGFSLTTEDEIRELVSKDFNGDLDSLSILTCPPKHSFIIEEQYKIAIIARFIQKLGIERIDKKILNTHTEIYNLLSQHSKKYFWKSDNYTESRRLDINDFILEINNALTEYNKTEKIIKNFESLEDRLKQREKLLKSVSSARLRMLLEINHVICEIHDRRKEYMTQMLHFLSEPLKVLAKRTKIPFQKIVYLLPDEIFKLQEVANDFNKRRELSVYYFSKDSHAIYTGSKAIELSSILIKDKLESTNEINELRGMVACLGQATGKVKVCRGLSELNKFKKGDILVACMTQPEFVPAMKIASAIITDEGGLTSHAAILSREFKIPCITGTKYATKILKDGDVVEVDANNGIVRILKS